MLGAFARSDKRAIKSDLEKVYAFFPILKERRKQLSGLLSGGQVQMLVVGRGLMAAPKMIMLDEPSAALAPLVVLDIFKQINRIRANGHDDPDGGAERAHGAAARQLRLRHS